MRQTFTIKYVIMGKTYKRDDYPFPFHESIGHQLETLLEIMHEDPYDIWEVKFQKKFLGGLVPCEEGEKSDYTFYLDETGLYDNNHNLIVTMEDRMVMWDSPTWHFSATDKDYKEDPLGLATPESMEDGEALAKKLLKSSLDVLRETTE